MNESSEHQDSKATEYAAAIKPGDAVETPDGALWTIEHETANGYALASAYRGATDGVLYNDSALTVIRTIVPAAHATKIADARQVRRG